IDGRLCVRRIRRCRSETFSPTIRERFHRTNISAAPWTSPVNHEFMLRREADRWVLMNDPKSSWNDRRLARMALAVAFLAAMAVLGEAKHQCGVPTATLQDGEL